MSDRTPADTIRAAIVKLERLRREASLGPWGAWKKPVSTLYRTDLVKYGLEDARGRDLFGAQSPENAVLIETLHATIDAQLHLLKAEYLRTRSHGRGIDSDVLALARAILGDDE